MADRADHRAEAPLLSCVCDPLAEQKDDAGEGARAWARIGVGGVVAGWGLVVGLAINVSEAAPMDRFRAHAWLAGMAGLVAIVLAPPLVRSTLRSVRERRLSVDALFVTGLLGAGATSAISTLSGEGAVFYETIAVLLVVYALGERARVATQGRALVAARSWPEAPRACRVETRGGVETRPVGDVRIGDVAIIPPGGACPIDGVIEQGEALVASAPMTGESFSLRMGAGDPIEAGCMVQDAFLRVRAAARGDARRIDSLIAQVERARERPSALQSEADRLTRWFLPIVLAIAVGVGLTWTLAEGWETGLFNAMAVLLVACPCALGVAAPVAVWTTLGDLARRGLVPTSGEVVERLASVDACILDKTGTLTEADHASVRVTPASSGPLSPEEVDGLIAGVQGASDHPFARALREGVGERQSAPRTWTIESVRLLPGRGLETDARDPRGALRRVRIGSGAVLDDASEEARRSWRALAEEREGEAPRLALLVDGRLAATIDLEERLRPGVREAIRELESLGVNVSILTGDPSAHAGGDLGAPIERGVTPESKAERVRVLRADGGRPLVVGDGFNDAPALAEAWVGVARGEGADLSRSAAGLIWTSDDAAALAWAVGRCREAVRGVRTNQRIAASYNAVGVTIAAIGWLHPVAAALLMMCSSAVVTFRALRLGESEREAEVFSRDVAGAEAGPARAEASPRAGVDHPGTRSPGASMRPA